MYMSKNKKPKGKLKDSLSHIIRKVFTENSDSSLNMDTQFAELDESTEELIHGIGFATLFSRRVCIPH